MFVAHGEDIANFLKLQSNLGNLFKWLRLSAVDLSVRAHYVKSLKQLVLKLFYLVTQASKLRDLRLADYSDCLTVGQHYHLECAWDPLCTCYVLSALVVAKKDHLWLAVQRVCCLT